MHATKTYHHQGNDHVSVFTFFRDEEGHEALREERYGTGATTRVSASRPLTPAERSLVWTERSEDFDLERQEEPQHYEFTA